MATATMELDSIPLEVEDGAAVEVCVVSDASGWRLAWMRDGGRKKETFGEPYAKVREACRAARKLNVRAQ